MTPLPQVDGVEFRLIPGFACYAVGDDGSVWSNCRANGRHPDGWHRLSIKEETTKCGLIYFYTHLRANNGRGRVLRRYVHRLVLEAFVGPCPDGLQTRHLDGDPSNNRPTNLAWGTSKENHADRRRHGTLRMGEQTTFAKLTAEQVRQIRARHAAGEKCSAIAADYGVHTGTVEFAVKRKTWRHVA